MPSLLEKLNASAKLTQGLERTTGDASGFLTHSWGPKGSDPVIETPAEEAAPGEGDAQETGQEIEAQETEQSVSSGRQQANALDNQMVADALLWRQLRSDPKLAAAYLGQQPSQASQASESEALSPEAQALYDEAKANPAYLELQQHLARKFMRTDPEFVSARRTQQQEIQAREQARTARLEREFHDLVKVVGEAEFTPEVRRTMNQILQALPDEPVARIYERATLKKVQKKTAPPPPTRTTVPVSSRTTSQGSPLRTNDIHEAGRRAKARLGIK